MNLLGQFAIESISQSLSFKLKKNNDILTQTNPYLLQKLRKLKKSENNKISTIDIITLSFYPTFSKSIHSLAERSSIASPSYDGNVLTCYR